LNRGPKGGPTGGGGALPGKRDVEKLLRFR